MVTFREAVERKDIGAVEEMLADDVVFRSPIAFKPYPGKPITAAILRTVVEVLEEFHYVREIRDAENGNHVLVFEAKVDGLAITGSDLLVYNEAGKISEFMVMVRPLSAAQALAARMGERFPEIQAAAIRAAGGLV